MHKLSSIMVSLSLALAGTTCWAQNAKVPFNQIEKAAPLSASLSFPNSEASLNRPSEADPPLGAASSLSYIQPTYKRPRVLDGKFFLINGLHLGLAAADIGLTQHCIATHHCREGNPMMPSSLAGQVAVDSSFIGYSAFISFKLKRQESKVWWLSPVVGIGAHAAGVVSGLVNR